MIRWFRCWKSNPASEPCDHTAVARARRDRDEATARMVVAVHLATQAWQAAAQASSRADRACALMWSMAEPGEDERCVKVRLRSKEEAAAFAARVFADTGERCVPYKCRHCPLQPVSLAKFWHITTADPNQRGKRRGPHHHQARLLRHVSPELADMLRARVQPEAS
jgi:hypothetical protein